MTELERLIEESSGYESYESKVNHLVRFGMPIAQARAAVQASGSVGIATGAPAAFANAKAQFDLIIKRSGATVLSGGAPCALPFALFGSLDALSGYKAVLATELPAGVTISNVQYSVYSGIAFGSKLTFTYTDGTHSDTITITCNQIDYPVFLESINRGLFEMNKIRYTISDVTQLAQFDNGMFTKFRTMFGKTGSDQISVGSWKDPKQFQNGIIDMDITVPVNGESSLITSLNPVDGLQITLSGFVHKYNHGNGKTV